MRDALEESAVLLQEADIIATALRASLVRDEAVDFTTRFYEDVYSIFIRPRSNPHFYFLYPVSKDTWITLFIGLVGIWLILIFYETASDTIPKVKKSETKTTQKLARVGTLALIVLRISLSQSEYISLFHLTVMNLYIATLLAVNQIISFRTCRCCRTS